MEYEYRKPTIDTALPTRGDSTAPATDHEILPGCQFNRILTHLENARVKYETGKSQELAEQIDQALGLSRRIHARHFAFHALILLSRLSLDKGFRKATFSLLSKALAIGEEIGWYYNAIRSSTVIARPCAVTSELGASQQAIVKGDQKCGLSPMSQLDSRPWPFRIYTLGRFSIVKDGIPISFTTKAPKKPLEMIKALIALGGRDVGKTRISDALWPEVEGDKADRAFATTLHRLRRLLGNAYAIQLQDGKLNLNASLCWVDCWIFERLLSEVDRAYERKDEITANALTEKAIRVYKGAFLASDDSIVWAMSTRERLRSKFMLAINRIGVELANAGQWEQAAIWYRRGLYVDALSEQSYQRLMRCLLQMGQMSECLTVYNRCKEYLRANRGVLPSPETQRIYRSLTNGF